MNEEKYVEMLEDGTLYDFITNLQEENEKIIAKNLELETLCDTYEEEHNTTFEEWKKAIKENERLKKENIKLYKKDTKIINELKEELQITQEKWDKDKQFSKCRTMEMLDYKSRNEKAIEFIKEKGCYYSGDFDDILDLYDLNDLLNILNGGDEE